MAKVNPAIAKDLSNGFLLCLICNTQVKSKVWIAHSNGRKHRENVLLFKSRHSTDGVAYATKRPLTEPSTSIAAPAKKLKANANESAVVSGHANGSSPWEKGAVSRIVGSSKYVQKKNIIEGVPEGFFEDEKLNNRVVDTIEKHATMEQEYANFMRELDEAKLVEEQREEIEEHEVAVERDIELIDEQIDQWRRVNRLELRREELYGATSEINETHKKEVNEEMSDDDDDDADFDLAGWRSKRI